MLPAVFSVKICKFPYLNTNIKFNHIMIRAASVLITDFSSLTTNSLGNWQSDDGTMAVYKLNNRGGGVQMQGKSGAYWYTILSTPSSGCYSAASSGGSYNYIRVVGVGFKSAAGSLNIQIQAGTGSTCSTPNSWSTNPLATWTTDTNTGYDVGEINLSLYNSNVRSKINTLSFNTLSPTTTTFILKSLSFESDSFSAAGNGTSDPPKDSKSLLLSDFQSLFVNSLGKYQSDDGTLKVYSLASNKMGINMVSKSGGYWYSFLGSSECFTGAVNYTYIRVVAIGAKAGGCNFNLQIEACTYAMKPVSLF